MHRLMIAGIGTDVGKTVVAAILATMLRADYWKPIQCGDEKKSDTHIMRQLLDASKHRIHPPAYTLKAALSPHHAARLENISIQLEHVSLPQTTRPLIIESVGGIFVPLTPKKLSLDLFKTWKCHWVIVAKHYLGSINHTLLTIDALKRQEIPLLGLIFNGPPNPDSESAIVNIAQLPLIGQLLPEKHINLTIIQWYAKQWQARFSTLLP